LNFRGPSMGSLESLCTNSYRLSIEAIDLNCLVFRKSRFCIRVLASDKRTIQTDRQTEKQTDSVIT